METIFQLMAILAVVVGTLFSVVGVVGFIRLPDVYTRLHATGKVGVFGVVLLLVAAVVGRRGLVLSAVPSIRAHWPWENALAMFDEWRRLRGPAA